MLERELRPRIHFFTGLNDALDLLAGCDLHVPGRGCSRRKLAGLARAAGRWNEPGNERAGELERGEGREHCLEGAYSWDRACLAGRLGRLRAAGDLPA